MYTIRIPIILFFATMLFSSAVAFGATEDVPIQALVGSDSTPPSVPLGLTATGVATTQIDLTWATSTDDFALSGYRVYRNDVQIATTTLPLYSDIGLTASTSYLYYVTAFDSSYNFSASSSIATGTTLSITVSVTPTSTEATSSTRYGSKASSFKDEIRSLIILPGTDSAVIRFETDSPIRTTVRWGETSSYETGSLIEQAFGKSHTIVITGLSPGQRYQYILEGENGLGKSGAMHQGIFVTRPPVDIFPPGNVTNLKAEKSDADIILTWRNPEDSDLTKIRIVYSNRFYPNDIADGSVIYEGLDTELVDLKRSTLPGRHFYTVFSYDALGNVSSGAIVSVNIGLDGEIIPPLLTEDADPEKNNMQLSLDDLVFMQDDELLIPRDTTIIIDGTKQLTISIPYDRVPEHLKTILIRVQSNVDSTQSFSFLLRINADKSAYTSVIAPFGISGTFPFVVSVFDFKTAQIGYTDGVLDSRIMHTRDPERDRLDVDESTKRARIYLCIFIVLLVLLTGMGYRLARARW